MLLLSGFFIAFFIALILITKKNKSYADFLLFFWLLFIAIHLASGYFFKTYQGRVYPAFSSLSMPLTLIHGPFLFLYTYKKTSGKNFVFYDILHFVPFFLWFVFSYQFYLSLPQKQVDIFLHGGKEFKPLNLIRVIITYSSGITYNTLTLLTLARFHKKIKQRFSDIEKINFNWLFYIIIWNCIIWIFVLLNQEKISYGLISVFIIWIGYFGFRQTDVFFEKNKSLSNLENDNKLYEINEDVSDSTIVSEGKYKNNLLSEEETMAFKERLLEYLTTQKPYLDPELSLQQLAENIHIHPNTLSYIINFALGKNFYDLINEYRINEFINLYQNSIDKYTILSLALDSGFNSKSAFNRNFKKIKGITPSEFISDANNQTSFRSTP